MSDQEKKPSNDRVHSSQNARKNGSSAIAIAITSGKGGVGKTNITTNLGIALAKSGAKSCVFDADTSLANINILLGLTPEHTLEHFLNDDLSIEEITIDGPENLKIIPSASGISEYANLDSEKQAKLAHALETLEHNFDYILIDTAAGISESVINFIQSAHYAIVVISPEPTSLTDAFSLIKVLSHRNYSHPIYILVNMTNNYKHSMEVFKRFAQAVNKYIQLKVRYLGYIPMDKAVRDAVASQVPVTVSQPDSPAGRCIYLLANILLKHFKTGDAPIRKISQFWREQYEKNTFASQSFTGDAIPEISDKGKKPVEALPTEPDQAPDEPAEVKNDHSGAKEDMTDQYLKTQSADNIDPFDLMSHMIADQKISQHKTDSLLAQLATYYQTQFGTLPEQVVDLVLQAHEQGEISDEDLELLKTRLIETELSSSPSDLTSIEKLYLKSTDVDPVFSKVERLVTDAERTKKELSELEAHIRKKYRELYNYDLAMKQTPVHLLKLVKNTAGRHSVISDTESLRQSIYFASAVDSRKADK